MCETLLLPKSILLCSPPAPWSHSPLPPHTFYPSLIGFKATPAVFFVGVGSWKRLCGGSLLLLSIFPVLYLLEGFCA